MTLTANVMERLLRYRFSFTGTPFVRMNDGRNTVLPFIIVGYSLGPNGGATYTMGLN
jgi:hypothetical protein